MLTEFVGVLGNPRLFNEFEELVNKVDAGTWEFFLLGDINVDLMVDTTSANAGK